MSDEIAARPRPPSTRRTRELAGVFLWLLVAVAWVVAMLVPWFRTGVLAQTSPLDVGTLLRAGEIGPVPAAAGFGMLVLPLLGVVLLGLAPVRGTGVMVARVLLWALGAAVNLGLVVVLRDLTAGQIGWGAGLLVTGAALGGVALLCGTVRSSDELS